MGDKTNSYWHDRVQAYKADTQHRQRVAEVLRREAECFYQRPPKHYGQSIADCIRALGPGESRVAEELHAQPDLLERLGELLRLHGIAQGEVIGMGGLALVVGNHDEAVRLMPISEGQVEFHAAQYLQPYRRMELQSLQPSTYREEKDAQAYRFVVEILPRFLRLEALVDKGAIREEDAALLGEAVAGSLLRQHPFCGIESECFFSNLGILPDGTPLFIDRDAIHFDPLPSCSRISRIAAHQRMASDFSWETQGEWKQKRFFPKIAVSPVKHAITPGPGGYALLQAGSAQLSI